MMENGMDHCVIMTITVMENTVLMRLMKMWLTVIQIVVLRQEAEKTKIGVL